MAEEEVKIDEYSIQDWEKIWKDYDDAKKPPRKVTDQLERYVTDLLPSGTGSVFLPLCGQTADLRWLYDRGCSVVGLDGVASAVAALVARNKDLGFSEEKTAEGAPLYKSRDGRLQLIVCDVLTPQVSSLGPFDAVYDYGAYTAIKPSDRTAYLSSVLATLKPDYRYLLEFCHDASKDCTFTPGSVSIQTMKREFGADKNLRFLETSDISEEWGVESFFNTFVLITPKTK